MFELLACVISGALFGLVFGAFFVANKGTLTRRRCMWLLFPFSQMATILLALWYGFSANMSLGYFGFAAFISVVCAGVDMFLLLAMGLAAGSGLAEEKWSYLESQLVLQRRYNRTYLKSLEEAREVKRSVVGIFGRVGNAVQDSEGLEAELGRLNMVAKTARKEKLCDHPVADAVLKLKLDECDAKGIKVSWRVVLPSGLEFSSVDLCAVFSNLMDNAMNACEKVEPERRCIDVRARVVAERLAIEVVNSCEDMTLARPRLREELLAIPSEIPEHGWGLSILRGIAWSNGGSLETAVEVRQDMGRVFRATIILGLGGG